MSEQFDAWNPGLKSQLPRELWPTATIFRPENVSTNIESLLEIKGLTGLPLSELVAFRPQRLALHELLIQITADLEVPDGQRVGDLGINFREIATRIFAAYIAPRMPEIEDVYQRCRARYQRLILDAVGRAGRRWGPEQILAMERLGAGGDPELACIMKTLAKVMSALFATQGQAWGTPELIASISLNMVCNELGSALIGTTIRPWVHEAVGAEGYNLLPHQERPVVINTKGASASGKSSLRPMQKRLVGALGVRWGDLALISPDIWRKQLLDYSSLGEAYKYAGAFTAEELQIIDQKLDAYMAAKHRRGEMPHLLIDRFRFDSFAADSAEAGSNLLTRFGQTLHLFFMITPPEMLVERAWARGLEFGRFKAVDDVLAHAVEAYSGMPDVFFTWVRRTDKRIRFEFLDNTVRLGERPRTAAFGDNATLNVLDVKTLLDMRRYAKINVNALEPKAVYPDGQLSSGAQHTDFLLSCMRAFGSVNFAEQGTGRIYWSIQSGRAMFQDEEVFATQLSDPTVAAGLNAVRDTLKSAEIERAASKRYLQDAATAPTLGQWGWSV